MLSINENLWVSSPKTSSQDGPQWNPAFEHKETSAKFKFRIQIFGFYGHFFTASARLRAMPLICLRH